MAVVSKEEEIINDDNEFIAAVITDKFKESFNTTQNPDDWNLKHIYNGGYSPMLGILENPRVSGIDFNTNVLTASATTVINPNLQNQNLNATVLINGEEILVSDIVAKAAIPYTKGLRKRFINATMSDPVIGTIFSILTFYVFNVGRKSAIRPIGDYRTKNINELNQMLEKIISIDIQEDCTNYLDNIDTHSHIWNYYAPLSFQHMLTHGTGAFFKELMNTTGIVNEELDIDIPMGTPAVLKELDPIYFEKIFQNRKTFKPLFLEYTDQNYELLDDELFSNPKTDKEISNEFKGWKQLVIKDPNKNNSSSQRNLMLPINQLVVFRNQMNIAPNVSFFGISKLFSSLPISEIQRELNYNVMPSVNKIQSQGSCIINTKIRSEAKNKELVKELQKGTNYIVTNSEGLDIKNIAINVDLAGLAKERFDNVLQIIMGLNFPSPLINFEGVTNRATMDTVLQFFQNTSLESLRDIVSIAMSDQWYLPNMMFYFNHVLPKTKLEGQSKEISKWNFINLKLKIITEFEKIDFDLFTEKLTALNPITFMSDQEKREKVGIDPFPINDPEAQNVEKVNNNLQDIGDIQKDPTRLLSDKDKEIADIKAQLAEVLAAIKDPNVAKMIKQTTRDKGISI